MAGGWQKGTTPGRASLGGRGTREDSELPTATRTQPREVARVRVRARLRAGRVAKGWPSEVPGVPRCSLDATV